MAMNIGGYNFEGPYTNTEVLKEQSGVYVICYEKDGTHFVLDVGESGSVKSRIQNHDRADQWKRASKGVLNVSVLYTPTQSDDGRRKIETFLRGKYNPTCGIR